MPAMRVLFVENEDSFSWNVIDRLPIGRDAIRLVSGRNRDAVLAAVPDADVVVVGPGPLDPIRAGLVDVVAAVAKPLLGICLGHQAIGLAFGARLVRTTPTHGKRSTVAFTPSPWLPGFVGEHVVMRYHSLAVADVVAPLRVTAVADDGTVMAIAHESRPILGLQFHPDSFGTPDGEAMLAAFFRSVA